MYARFLFLSLLLAGIVADRIALETQLKLNVSTPPSKLETGQSANFYFVVPSNFSTGANYLIFDVAGADDAANDPDIYISSVRSVANRVDQFSSHCRK
ncbi:MAG: hypothetical protein P4M11_02275 [Candidatus Pacebacteria bacterium]|nr:hypothetical protein [Candidatus Paceibacterota bacterium]